MYYFFYEDSSYESKVFATYDEAMNAWDDIGAEVASLFGYCDSDRLFMAEFEE